ncbi:MAG: DUF3035 domain-containing protein [Alphaproteobacteria bacterium]|nr:DUF3035 domain-containing protein [Alphaproteobacteria bacterium]
MKTYKKIISNTVVTSIVISSLSALSGCSNVTQSMGLDIPPPDEFTVITRPPLELPPNFELRPPMSGTTAPKAKAASETAKDALIKSSDNTKELPAYRSKGENAFAKKANIDDAEEGIRNTIEKETTSLTKKQESFADKLIFWKEIDHDPTKIVVDADKENQRIDENSALEKPINEGKVPTIKKKREGFLEGIF